MSPRAEFIVYSLTAAAALTVAVVLLMDVDRRTPGMAELASALRLMPAAMLAAGPGAWFVARWHARASAAGHRWKTGGMTLRLLLVVFLLLPFAIAAGAVAAAGIDPVVTSRPAGFAQALGWLPVIVFYGSLAALLFGAVPLFVLEYFACRRYLRRQAVPSTDHA
jgi:hypothetical protein|nr:hypothetical protein [uncultured Pseudoxanthomonas sp.]